MRGIRTSIVGTAVAAAVAVGFLLAAEPGAPAAGIRKPDPPAPFVAAPTLPSAPPTTAVATTPPVVTTMPATRVVEEPTPPAAVTLLFTGDVLVHEAVADSARLPGGGYDFRPMFEHIAPVVTAADLAICHLETPLDPESRTPRGWPRFSAPAEVAPALVDAGFDGCSTASNHVLDRGLAGVGETLDVLDGAGLGHTGSAREPSERFGVLYEAGSLTVGHASYSLNVGGWLAKDKQWVANGLDEAVILQDAADLKDRGADFVVVSVHWGVEHQYRPNRQQIQLGETLSQSPLIDLIVGHHAHVLQPVEHLNGTVVFYGLGNLLSNQEPGCCGEEAQEGALMLVRIEPRDDRWTISEVRFVPTWVDRRRSHAILATLAADVPDHRHAAWLMRSADRVGRSLGLEGAGLSIESACQWMGVDCSPIVAGAS